MSKPVVIIYIQEGANSTKLLTDYIGKHLDKINQFLLIKFVKVNSKNVQLVKAKGIERTPTLVYNRKKYISVEKIISILTPPAHNQDHYGYGNTSSDDLIYEHNMLIMQSGEEEDQDEDSPDNRSQILKQKMAAFQKRRPEMQGVDSNRAIKGGRKFTARAVPKSDFNNDAEFVKAARVDNVENTPFKYYLDDMDGNSILENYYLDEANKSGKKVGRVVSKRR